VAIANALQLEAARATPVLSRFNYDAMPSLKSLNLSIAAFLLLIHYFTLWPWYLTAWPWPLTFDLEHLQYIACDLTKLCTKFEHSRAIRGGVIAI